MGRRLSFSLHVSLTSECRGEGVPLNPNAVRVATKGFSGWMPISWQELS